MTKEVYFQMKRHVAAWGFWAFACIAMVSGAGCSPGMFAPKRQDGKVLAGPGYRKINTACGQMDISSSTLSVKDFRDILSCMNAYGGLQPLQDLTDSLSDQELAPLVEVQNKYLLNDKKKLYALDQTYLALDRRGILESSLQQLARLLENTRLITSSLALMKSGHVIRPSDGKSVPDPDLLRAFELVAAKLTNETWRDAIDLGKTYAEAPAFQSLQKHFRGDSPARRGLLPLMEGLHRYLKEPHTYPCQEGGKVTWVDLKPEFLQALLEPGDHLFQVLNQSLGVDFDSKTVSSQEGMVRIQKRVSELAAFFQATRNQKQGDSQKTLLAALSEAFSDLNGPIECMQGATSIPNGAIHLIRELLENTNDPAKYILRDNRLNLVSLSPFCRFPARMDAHYQALTETVETGVMPQMSELLRTLYQDRGLKWKGCNRNLTHGPEYPLLAHLMINFLGDTGFDPKTGVRGGGISHLLPLLDEVTDRKAWVDLFLVLALPSEEAQAHIQETTKFIFQPMPQLRGDSIADVLIRAFSRAPAKTLYEFVSSLQPVISSDEPFLGPVLSNLRSAYYVNNVHPVLDFVHELMAHASENVDLYTTLFIMAERPQFAPTLELFSQMAKDGSLKDLASTLVSLFRKFAEQGKGSLQIEETPEPLFHPQRRHALHWVPEGQPAGQTGVKDLILKPIVPGSYPGYTEGCRKLRPSFSLAQVTDADYPQQLEFFLSCLKGGPVSKASDGVPGKSSDPIFVEKDVKASVVHSVQFLKQVRTDQNLSYFSLGADLARRLIGNTPGSTLSPSAARFMLDAWIKSYDEGPNSSFFTLLNQIPLWVQEPLSPGHGPALKPLIEVVGGIANRAKPQVQRLERLAGEILADSEAPQILQDIESLSQKDRLQKAAAKPKSRNHPTPADDLFNDEFRAKIGHWVNYKECADFPIDLPSRQRRIDERVQEIIDEAKYNVTTWDLVPADENSAVRRTPRQSWTVAELKSLLDPVFKKIADQENQSTPEKWLLDSNLNFLNYFLLPQGQPKTALRHYSPEKFVEWLYERSIDYRLITYFYPGETKPRVRLVNTLDLMELVVINVDFTMPIPPYKNMALDFLQEVAEAWGDEDPENWPKEIKEKFPDAQRGGPAPRTMLSAVQDIVNRPGWLGTENLHSLTYDYIGLPELPKCYQNLPGEDPERQAFPKKRHLVSLAGYAGLLGGDKLQDFQNRLFNLWQVNTVLFENALDSHVGRFNSGKGGGLEVLRNLFFEAFYSTPQQFRDPTQGDRNNLSAILRLVRMGTLRQLGRQLMNFQTPSPSDPEWRVVTDLGRALIRSSASPHMRELLVTLLKNDAEHRVIWQVIKEVFQAIDDGSPTDLARLKQLGFYGLPALASLQKWAPSPEGDLEKGDLLDLSLASMNAVFTQHQDFLLEQSALLQDLLKSEKASSAVRLLYEEQDQEKRDRLQRLVKRVLSGKSGQADPSHALDAMELARIFYSSEKLKENWKTFLARYENLRQRPGGDWEENLRPLLDFFEQKNQSQDSRAASNHLRTNLAAALRSNDLSPFLFLAGHPENSEKFYQVLQTLSQVIGQGNEGPLKDFLKNIIRPSLSEKPYTRYSGPHGNTGRAIAN